MSLAYAYRRLSPDNPMRRAARFLRRHLAAHAAIDDRRSLAHSLMSEGRHSEALAIFRSIVTAHPQNRLYFGEYCRALSDAGRMDELRTAAIGVDFHIFDDMRPRFLHDLTDLERQIFAEVAIDSCQSPEAIAQLSRAVRYLVEHDVKGDLVECGVYKGASIVCMARTLQAADASRTIWLYDTFEGMPEPEPVDRFYCESEGEQQRQWERTRRDDGSGGSNWVWGPIDDVRRNVRRTGHPEHLLRFVKGKVEDTIPAHAPQQIALLRLDTDFYASTRHEMQHLYPRVVSGGVVIIDDYGAYRGARQAVDEYIAANCLRVLLSRVDEHVRMFVRP